MDLQRQDEVFEVCRLKLSFKSRAKYFLDEVQGGFQEAECPCHVGLAQEMCPGSGNTQWKLSIQCL